MKQIFTLIIAAFAALTVKAQSDFALQFADADGNIIADGTTLTLTKFVDDGFGVLIPTGLYVKNQSESAVQGGGAYEVNRLDNGAFQTCFPQNCVSQSRTGSYETANGEIKAGELKNMQTEWLPDEAGQAQVNYQLATFKQTTLTKKWKVDKYGPKIMLNFSYDPMAINAVENGAQELRSVEYYTMDGRRVAAPAKGIYVVRQRFLNGRTIASKQRF